MKIALIGRGKLATNLLPALQHAGHDVVSVNSRTLEELPQTADAYIIAVKDSVLADVIRAVTKGREEQVFMHTAGSMPMSLFQGMAHHYGVFYPMQSFSKERTVYFAEIPTFIEANDDKTKQVIRQLAESVTQHVIELSSDDRQYLHLALCPGGRDIGTTRYGFQRDAAFNRRNSAKGASVAPSASPDGTGNALRRERHPASVGTAERQSGSKGNLRTYVNKYT